jgi:hypothetical protein
MAPDLKAVKSLEPVCLTHAVKSCNLHTYYSKSNIEFIHCNILHSCKTKAKDGHMYCPLWLTKSQGNWHISESSTPSISLNKRLSLSGKKDSQQVIWPGIPGASFHHLIFKLLSPVLAPQPDDKLLVVGPAHLPHHPWVPDSIPVDELTPPLLHLDTSGSHHIVTFHTVKVKFHLVQSSNSTTFWFLWLSGEQTDNVGNTVITPSLLLCL